MFERTVAKTMGEFADPLDESVMGFSIGPKSKRKLGDLTVYSIDEVMSSDEPLEDSYNPRGNRIPFFLREYFP